MQAENFFFPLDNLPSLTVRMVLYTQHKKLRIDEKNRENQNRICGKLFFCMCKNNQNIIKALLLKDIPLGGYWPHT